MRPVSRKVITSGDVARLAGVSQSAVSRAFTPGASVAPETRDRILKAASELGYRPNALARAMISGRSKLVALLVAYMDNQFYPMFVDKVSRRLQENGYNVLLVVCDRGLQDKMVQQIMQYQVEGIVMASSTLSSDVALECAHTGIPVVLFNRVDSTIPISSVTPDNTQGGRLAADFLLSAKHQRIAFIAGDERSSANRDRENGFYKEMEERGASVWARAVGGFVFAQAEQAARELFTKDEIPDAVFVANDHMAFAVMDVLREELKLRVPEDVSVIGFDNVPEARWRGYDLTTVSQEIPDLIDRTLEILLEQIENQVVEKAMVVSPVKLVVRGSARLPTP